MNKFNCFVMRVFKSVGSVASVREISKELKNTIALLSGEARDIEIRQWDRFVLNSLKSLRDHGHVKRVNKECWKLV